MKGRTFFTTLMVIVLMTTLLVPYTVAQEPVTESDQPAVSAEKLQSQLERGRISEAEYEAAMVEAGLEGPVRGLPEGDVQYIPPGWLVVDNLGTGGMWNTSDTFGVANRTNSLTPTSMAAEAYLSGIAWDTEIWTPPFDLSNSTAATLEFENQFQDYAGNGDAWVDISTDGGATWTNIWFWTTDHGPTYETVDLTPFVGQLTWLRFRYACTSSTSWYWHIDDVWVFDQVGTLLFESFEPPPAPDFSGSWKEATPKVEFGEPISYTVYISNSGNLGSVNTLMTDTFPVGTTFIPGSLSCSDGTCNEDGTAVYWNGDVPTSTIVTVDFAVTPDAAACGDAVYNEAEIWDRAAGSVTVEAWTEVWDMVWLHEDFEGAFPPAGWVVTATQYLTVPGAVFTNTNPGGRANLTGGSGAFAIVDDDEAGSAAVGVETQMWLPPLDIPACAETYLIFKTDYNNISANEIAAVDISLDGGATWENLLLWNYDVRGPYTEAVPLGAYAGATDAILRFYYNDGGSYAWWWEIDDVQIVSCMRQGLFLEPDYQEGEMCPNGTMSYTLSLENCTGASDTFDLSVSGNEWFTWVDPDEVTLDQGEMADLTAYVEVPCEAEGVDEATITATGQAGAATDDAVVSTNSEIIAWQVMAPLPEGRVFHAAAATDEYYYVVGGTSDAGGTIPTDTNYRYDIANDTWDTMASLPVPLESINAGIVGDNLYVPGGDLDANTYVYDTVGDAWSVIAPSGTFTWAIQYSVAVSGTTLYRLGGLVDDGLGGYLSTNRVWALDTVAGTWTELPPMQMDRTSFGAASIGGMLYVAGGVHYPGFAPEMTSEAFDGATWSYVAPVPDGGGVYTRWSYNADAVMDGKLWLMAGRRDAGWTVLDNTGFYDPATDSWTTTPDLPVLNQGRVYLQGAAGGGYLFATGGRDSAGAVIYDTHERYGSLCPEVSAEIEVEPLSLAAPTCPGDTETLEFTICSVGDCTLDWSIREMTPTVKLTGSTPSFEGSRAVELAVEEVTGGSIEAGPWTPDSPVSLILDDNTVEGYIGVNDGTDGTQWVWINRFTPDPADFPFMVEEIATIFGGTGTAVGDDVDLLVMQDTDGDGDPSNATLVAVYPATIQANDGATWNVYSLSTPAALYGPGDVLIGIINRYQPGTGAGLIDYPAAQDRTSSAYRSWAGWWSVDAPPDPPTWPPDVVFGIIDDLAPTLAGNWMVRGAGETFIPPVDIPWISTDPSAGSLAAGECVTVEVTLDAMGVDPGEYYAWLVVDSNDPMMPEVTLPVTMTVWEPTAIDSVTWMTATDSCQVDFDATASGGSGDYTFAWDFGDGFGDVGPSVSHEYAAPGGIFTVSLTVEGDCGTAMWEEAITVSCAPPTSLYYLPIIVKNY